MSHRLNIERQNKLEPKRISYAKQKLTEVGITITFETAREIQFYFKGELIKFFPYSGWHSGKSITDGRGLDNLLTQLRKA